MFVAVFVTMIAGDRLTADYWLSAAIFSTVQSEVYRFPMYISRSAVALACLGVTAAALISALLVRRRLDQLDLIAVLKVRE